MKKIYFITLVMIFSYGCTTQKERITFREALNESIIDGFGPAADTIPFGR